MATNYEDLIPHTELDYAELLTGRNGTGRSPTRSHTAAENTAISREL